MGIDRLTYRGEMRVAAIQHDIVWEDPAANFVRLAPMIRAAGDDGAQLIVLSEMFATGFTMRSHMFAEPIDGPTVAFLIAAAQDTGAHVAGSFACSPTTDGETGARIAAPLPTNTLVVARPNGDIERYDKIHPFTFARENDAYAAGSGVHSVLIDGVRVSLFVCYDLRFAPEIWSVAPTTDLYIFPANWPASRRHHWTSLLTARAIENQAYVLGANRVGTHGKLSYVGDSMIVGPLGETLAHAEEHEAIVMATVDPELVARVRSAFPFMADR